MSGKIHKYEGQALQITYDVKRCIHAAECVHGLPTVFNSKLKPWVSPDAAPAEAVLRVVMRCPTGALQAERRDGGDGEPVPPVNTLRVSAAGPLFLRGSLAVVDGEGAVMLRDTRIALCRCGASANKPFCDGHHTEVGFTDPGSLSEIKLKQGEAEGGELRIQPAANGPLVLSGPVQLVEDGGRTLAEGTGAALCRCGASANKPFCDGSHKKVGFEAGS